MGPTYPLGHVEVLRRPALRPQPPRGTERKTGIVAIQPASVLVARERAPEAREVHLRKRWDARERHQQHGQTDSSAVAHVSSVKPEEERRECCRPISAIDEAIGKQGPVPAVL